MGCDDDDDDGEGGDIGCEKGAGFDGCISSSDFDDDKLMADIASVESVFADDDDNIILDESALAFSS